MTYESPENSLQLYLRDISRTPLLTLPEEYALAERIKNGDESAREQMIKANLRLVVKIAKEYSFYGLPFLDLISEGNIGLMKAVEKFDPNKGGKMSTYGSWWIKQSIMRALANQSNTIRLPVHMLAKISRMKRIITQLTYGLGREPTDEELADAIGIPEENIRTMKCTGLQTISMDEPQFFGEAATYGEIIRDEHAANPFETLSDKNMHSEIATLLDILDSREREIIEKRFRLNGYEKEFTLDEVGRDFGVTRERIRQIEKEAIRKMQRALQRKERKSQEVSRQEPPSKRIESIVATLSSQPTCPEVLSILQKSGIVAEDKERELRHISAGGNANWYTLSVKALRELRKTKADKGSHKKITYADVETFLRATVFSAENTVKRG